MPHRPERQPAPGSPGDINALVEALSGQGAAPVSLPQVGVVPGSAARPLVTLPSFELPGASALPGIQALAQQPTPDILGPGQLGLGATGQVARALPGFGTELAKLSSALIGRKQAKQQEDFLNKPMSSVTSEERTALIGQVTGLGPDATIRDVLRVSDSIPGVKDAISSLMQPSFKESVTPEQFNAFSPDAQAFLSVPGSAKFARTAFAEIIKRPARLDTSIFKSVSSIDRAISRINGQLTSLSKVTPEQALGSLVGGGPSIEEQANNLQRQLLDLEKRRSQLLAEQEGKEPPAPKAKPTPKPKAPPAPKPKAKRGGGLSDLERFIRGVNAGVQQQEGTGE